MDELFIDGTVKCCPRYFCQLYTIHGLKNGYDVPLVFCLLPSKTEMCYTAMWSLIIDYCKSKNLYLLPTALHLDFEKVLYFPSWTVLVEKNTEHRFKQGIQREERTCWKMAD